MKKKKTRIDKVVTKLGDEGFTYLIGGARVKKSCPRVEAYGNVDEVNSLIGFLISFMQSDYKEEIEMLKIIQNNLFIAGADLAAKSEISSPRINDNHINYIEKCIEKYKKNLPDLEEFILPGGNIISSLMHLIRTVIRRTERSIVKLTDEEEVNPKLLIYFNRLSDLFFILARFINKKNNITESYCRWM